MVFGILLLNHGSGWVDSRWGPMNSRLYIVTPDRDTADLLFRVLMDHGPNFPMAPLEIIERRPSPQVWTWRSLRANSQDDVQQPLMLALNELNYGRAPIKEEYKKRLSGRITFDWRGNWDQAAFSIPEIPHLDIPDHITGCVFSIRDKSCPTRFWAKRVEFPHEGNIEVSDVRKSRFRITVKGREDGKTVMVFDDEVFVELVERNGKEVKYLPVIIDDSDGRLRIGRQSEARLTTISFGRLLRGGLISDFYQGKGDTSTQYPTWVNSEFNQGDWWDLTF